MVRQLVYCLKIFTYSSEETDDDAQDISNYLGSYAAEIRYAHC